MYTLVFFTETNVNITGYMYTLVFFTETNVNITGYMYSTMDEETCFLNEVLTALNVCLILMFT